MLQAKWGKDQWGEDKWLDPVYADPKEKERGTTDDTPDNPDGFTQVHGTYAKGQGLSSFMGIPVSGADVGRQHRHRQQVGTPWTSVEPARLPLDRPARIVGYPARIKETAQGQKVIDSVRFLVRSFAESRCVPH